MEKKPAIAEEQDQKVRINLANMDETVARLAQDAENGKGFTIFTLNLDHLVKLRFDKLFRAVYLRAKYVTADGWPVVWLGRRKGGVLERTTGADLVVPLCKEAAKRRVSVYFFGSSDRVLQDAKTYLTGLYPDLEVVGLEAPEYGFSPFSKEADLAIERISKSGAGLCFLALGAPKQEFFADRAFGKCNKVGFLCIGAALDFLGGHQERAPLWMQKTGTEWLFRLIKNPRRLIGRYTRSALVFAEMVARQLLGRPDNKIDFSIWDLKK